MNGVPLQDTNTLTTNSYSLPNKAENTTNDFEGSQANLHKNDLALPFVEKSLNSQDMKEAPFNLALKSVTKETLIKSEVPDVSYASSDDEDCFYDAREDSSDILSPVKEMKAMNLKNLSASNASGGDGSGEVESTDSVTDYDHLYDTDDDDDFDSMESHGSVISHLISQVKIGMDLTKVALPTFILERRSLLEMYADFFAHPDIFVSITDQETPQDRMIQMVRWYLSAFHAGRKGSVAKKPYNPVLGEVFKCHWNLSNSESV